MLLRCCSIHITIIILRYILYLVFLCPCPGLGLFMSYLLCDLFFIFIFIFIIMNHNIILLKQTHFLAYFSDIQLILFLNSENNRNKIPRKRVFRREIFPGQNRSCLWWNISYCLHVFAKMNIHPGMNSKRQGWNFIPGWKKEKNRVNTSSRYESFKRAYFFKNFWPMYSNMLSKMFELNESINLMKQKASS